MNPKLRVRLLAGIFVVLVGANLYYRWGGDSFDGGMFWNDASGIDTNYSGALQRTLNVVRSSPKLSFRNQSQAVDQPEIKRNPFIFGIDRRAEATQRQRLANLAQARQEAMETAAAQPVAEVVVSEEETGFGGEVVAVFENLENGIRKAAVRTEQGMTIVRSGDVIDRRFRVIEVTYGYLRLHDLKLDRDLDVAIAAK